ncbi:MAG: homoserine O-acetyltransferase [Betaproteobacteria bacterium]|nr:homoserine O-acetyltransferase [Betaproteobacteria bacterium]
MIVPESVFRAFPRLAVTADPSSGPAAPRTAVLRMAGRAFATEGGESLPELEMRFETYGRPSARRDNAVLVFHALSGSAHLAGQYSEAVLADLSSLEQAFGAEGWWEGLVGEGRLLDPARDYVICANHPGSCYGSTGPLSVDPRSGRPYGRDFPALTVRDLARVQARLLDHLGVEQAVVIGGSLGGMVALEFALMFPERVKRLAVVAAPARQGPWARAWNRLSREAILADQAYYRQGPRQAQPTGLALARAIAMLSYRSPESFLRRWSDDPARGEDYPLHQGEKFIRRFDASSYLVLSAALDSHDIGRGRGGIEAALKGLKAPALFLGIDSDILYPASEIEALARLARAEYALLRSPHGHDAFLIETGAITELLSPFLGTEAGAGTVFRFCI